ncbi:MAG: hypothetical protein ACI37J_04270 [Candidatus Bruticola sp.]
MNTNHLSINLQSAQSYLNEALEKFDDMIDFLQNLSEEELEASVPIGTLSQIERAQALVSQASSALDKIKLS